MSRKKKRKYKDDDSKVIVVNVTKNKRSIRIIDLEDEKKESVIDKTNINQ